PAVSSASTFASTGSSRNTASVSRAAAHDAGNHDHVEPVDRSSKPIARSVPRTAPIGMTPPPIALPSAIRSGRTPQRWTANIEPDRPYPLFTSSTASKNPNSSQSSLSAVQNAGGGATQPPEPSTGSITTAATSAGSTAWNNRWSRM